LLHFPSAEQTQFASFPSADQTQSKPPKIFSNLQKPAGIFRNLQRLGAGKKRNEAITPGRAPRGQGCAFGNLPGPFPKTSENFPFPTIQLNKVAGCPRWPGGA
jgi:hypothetical protein